MKFGYNLDTASIPIDVSLPAMQASNGDSHLLMFSPNSFFLGIGELETIRRFANALPNVTLIIRVYSRLEGDWKKYSSADEYRKHWQWVKTQLGTELMKRIVLDDPVNEPMLGGEDKHAAKAYVTRCIEMVKAAYDAGVKLAIGAFSVGTPHENLLETEYLPLWKALSQYKQALSVHLYGAIPFEAGETETLEIVLNAKTARSYMRGKWDMGHQGYLIARSYRIIQLFEKYQLGTPEIYVTECIVDNVFNSGNSHIKEAWRAKYGIDKYQRDPRGIFCWENYLKDMFPELAFDQAITYLLSYARKNIFYHPAFRGACLFALNAQWGYPSGTNKEAGSNYADPALTRFRNELLPKLNAEIPGDETMPANILYPARVKSPIGSNIRNAPAGAQILGNTGVLAEWAECQLSRKFERVNGSPYDWFEVSINGTHGWIADTLPFEFEYSDMPEEPTGKLYYLDFNGATKILSETEYRLLLEIKRLEYEALRDMLPE